MRHLWLLIIVSMFFALWLLAPCVAEEIVTIGEYTFAIHDNAAEVILCNPDHEILMIPDVINGIPVTGIRQHAFDPCEDLVYRISIPDSVTEINGNPFASCASLEEFIVSGTHPSLVVDNHALIDKTEKRLICYPAGRTESSFSIPDGIRMIGEKAFMLSGLAEIIIPDSVTTIGDEAFGTAFNLKQIIIPNSVIHFGENPFLFCRNLETIGISSNHPGLMIVDRAIICKEDMRLLCVLRSEEMTSYSIPEGIREIGAKVFYFHYHLSEISMPDTVTAIGNEAFYYCDLIEVCLPEKVVSIGDFAFAECRSLTRINIPASVSTVGKNPFNGCFNLTDMNVSPDNASVKLIDGVLFDLTDNHLVLFPPNDQREEYTTPAWARSIGEGAFESSNLSSIVLSDGIDVIEDNAFTNCFRLNTIIIPESVTRIGAYAFAECYSVESISIPDTVCMIGDGAFRNCKSLAEIQLPALLTRIGDETFSFCKNLKHIDIPTHVTSIGNYAFGLCSSIRGIHIPDGVMSIGKGAFSECTSLADVSLPKSLSRIEARTFESCTALEHIDIPCGIYSIGNYAFAECQQLNSVTIPVSVTKIGINPFSNCQELSELQIAHENSALQIIDDALFSNEDHRLVFYPFNEVTSYAIPEGTEIIGEGAFEEHNCIEEVFIPNGVVEIRKSAFFRCNLVKVNIPPTVKRIEYGAFCETYLTSLIIPKSVIHIDHYALDSWEPIVFTVCRGSYAERYCIEEMLDYVYAEE